MSRVVLAMSGGVDSSVAASLLLEQGHEVIGVFMRHGHESPAACVMEANDRSAAQPAAADARRRASQGLQLPVVNRLDHQQGCCTAADAEDARRVADRLQIPFYALNLDREFGRIIDYFVEEYVAGRTPNPCVQCNNWIKFGKLFDYADGIDAQFVATGHYAQIVNDECGDAALKRGEDSGKDQSYVLFGIERRLLDRMLLPVGSRQKSQIRELAAQLGLDVAQKRDSQEICFVTQGRYDQFVRARQNDAHDGSGELVLADGTVVGRHSGVECFTVGQRKGLGVALGEPKYVVRIDADQRRVVLGDRSDLFQRELVATNCNWLIDEDRLPRRCSVQIRYNAPAAAASVQLLADQRLQVRFDEPQFGVAPGQAAVCYDGPRTLGGGWIESPGGPSQDHGSSSDEGR